MSLRKKIFLDRDGASDKNYTTFWGWFMENEKSFHAIVSHEDNVDQNFLDKLFPKLQSLNPRFYCQTGMYDEETAELIVSAESDIKTFVFVEDLVAAAPTVERWRFTALTPPTGFHDANIEMDGYRFDANKITFISKDTIEYPDEIDLTLFHADFNETNNEIITSGTLIYLENALGELNTATLIDQIEVKAFADQSLEPIPIEKLGDFLLWKEKEFVEKYDGIHYHIERENYATLQGKDKDGLPLIAIISQDLLDWEAKASHPWMMIITIKYENGNNGIPDRNTSALLERIEEDISGNVGDTGNCLMLGRKTYNDTRTIYFACKEFRGISKKVSLIEHAYREKINISYDIYKDKYWITMNQFKQS